MVQATRLVRDYVQTIYEPAGAGADAVAADGCRLARDLSAWKAKVREGWSGISIRSVVPDEARAELGGLRRVEVAVELGDLSPSDVQVELIHGHVGHNDELEGTQRETMALTGKPAGGTAHFSGEFVCHATGRYGFSVRVVPQHEGFHWPADLGLARWAERSR